MEELAQGSVFGGRYRLEELKGRGSYGEVWLAKDIQLDIDVALKIYIALDDRGIEEFKAEFRNAYNLNHPNLLHATHFDTDGRRPFLVMPYCPSSSLELIGKCEEPLLWRIIADVTAGLAYLHNMDIVHHDIKPDNILRDVAGNFVITDFGISANMRSTLRRNSQRDSISESLGGSLAYMGPEMFTETPESIKATDIWALGATLFEIATGELPFFGQGGIMLGRGAEIPSVKGPYSMDLKRVIRDCLAGDTWNRPQAQALCEYARAKVAGRPAQPSWAHVADNAPATSVKANHQPAATRLMLHNDPAEMPESKPVSAPVSVPVSAPVNNNVEATRIISSDIPMPPAQETPVRPPVSKIPPVMPFTPPQAKPAPQRPAVSEAGKFNVGVIIWLCANMAGYLFWAFVLFLHVTNIFPGEDKMQYALIIAALLFKVAGHAMMLQKGKFGFWVAAITPVLLITAVAIIAEAAIFIIGVSFMIESAATFGMTMIRRNGVSAWKVMKYSKMGGWIQWLVVAGGIALVFLMPNNLENAANEAYGIYTGIYRNVESLINKGSDADPKPLVDAIEAFSSLKNYEGEYYFDKRFNKSGDLLPRLKKKTKSAAAAWKKAAQSQRVAGNREFAAELESMVEKLQKANNL